MATKTIYGAAQELRTVVDAVAGVDWAPEHLTEQVVGLTAIVYGAGGQFGNSDPAKNVWKVSKGLHRVDIALILQEGSTPQQYEVLIQLVEPIVEALENHRNGNTSSHYSTFIYVTYDGGRRDWGGFVSYGIIFSVHGLKIENTLS